MAITIPRAHAGRALAVKALRRSPLVGRYANVSYPPVIARGSPDATPPPTGSKALAGAFVFLGIALFAIIGVCVWRYKNNLARKRAHIAQIASYPSTKPSYSEKSSFDVIYGFGITKPEPALHHGEVTTPSSRGAKWAPKLRASIALPTPISPRSHKAKKNWEKNLAKFMSPQTSNPPTYFENDPNSVTVTRVMPPMPELTEKGSTTLPPTPMKPSSVESPPVTPDSRSNLLSPRSSSFANQMSDKLDATTSVPTKSEKPAEEKKMVPRLMTVTTTFTPTMSDELAIVMGDTVRLLEEYADEWCLVQRVGKIDEIKGIIPRFCLSERQGMVPRLPAMGRNPFA